MVPAHSKCSINNGLAPQTPDFLMFLLFWFPSRKATSEKAIKNSQSGTADILCSCECWNVCEGGNCTLLDSYVVNQKYVYWHILCTYWHWDVFKIFIQKLQFSNFKTRKAQTRLWQTTSDILLDGPKGHIFKQDWALLYYHSLEWYFGVTIGVYLVIQRSMIL